MVNTAREALMRGYSCTGSLRRGKLGKKVRKGWKHATTMQWRWRENDGGGCSYRYLARLVSTTTLFPTRSLSPLLIILLSLSSIVGGTTLSLFHTFLLQPNSSLIHTHSLSLCVSVTTLLPHGSRGRLLRQGRSSCTATHRRREASRMQRLRHHRFREAAGAYLLS